MKKNVKLILSGFVLTSMLAAVLTACTIVKPPVSGDNKNGTEQQTADTGDKKDKKEEKQDAKTGDKTESKSDSKTDSQAYADTEVKTDTEKDSEKDSKKDSKKDDKKDSGKDAPDVPGAYVGDVFVARYPEAGTNRQAEAIAYADGLKVSYDYGDAKTELTLTFKDDGTYEFAEENTLYSKDLHLTIEVPKNAAVYYTLDGKEPTKKSTLYTGRITFKAKGSSFPDAYIIRAKAFFNDGTESMTAARTYLTGTKLDGRFSTLIFSITGDASELTDAPNGILYGDNAQDRGRESERAVHVEAWRANGKCILDQFAGVRVYGGYSRNSSIKSLKLFSRKSYDPDNKNFKLKDFGTIRMDGSGDLIKSYDKLVLRNCGNDLQFSYIRDELSQTLCKIAGFDDYEQVIPAVVYLNGTYYNFCWLHENYCDKYFKEKYGEDAPGEFYILEGGETEKADDDDPETQKLVDEYNRIYNELIKLDLTKDSNYKRVTDFMDVESYLDFFAWNITINNWDWPNNNYKIYKYVPENSSDPYNEGVFDGRWRFLVHDMDYTYGLYDQDKAKANYNTLRVVLQPNHDSTRYAPLFAKLMERKDCRDYFRAKTFEFLDGAFSEDTIKTAYYLLHATRKQELSYYYDFLTRLSRKGDFTIWSQEGHYDGYEQQILTFAEQRGGYVRKYMEELLPALK